MATFGKNLDVFQEIAGGNLNVLRELIHSSAELVRRQPDSAQTIVPAPQIELGIPADGNPGAGQSREI
jgi:hypothetical protein